MARIYSPNEDYNRQGIGVNFYNGAGVSTDAGVIARLEALGFSIDSTKNALSQFDLLKKSDLQQIATIMGISLTKVDGSDTVNLTKQELVAAIEKFVDKGILPLVTEVTSSGLTNLVLKFSEALYDGASAVANGADLKAKFTASAGVTITSALYATATKAITFVIADAAEAATLVYTGVTLKDSAGGVLGNLSYTAGAEAWAATA